MTRLQEGKCNRSARSTSSTLLVHFGYRDGRIDQTMEVDDLAVVGLTHAHVMHVADARNLCCDRG
jgi:hypothetical protein